MDGPQQKNDDVLVQVQLGQTYYAPQVRPTGVRTHDLHTTTVHFMSLRRLL